MDIKKYARVLELTNEGASTSEIAMKVGLSVSQTYKYQQLYKTTIALGTSPEALRKQIDLHTRVSGGNWEALKEYELDQNSDEDYEEEEDSASDLRSMLNGYDQEDLESGLGILQEMVDLKERDAELDLAAQRRSALRSFRRIVRKLVNDPASVNDDEIDECYEQIEDLLVLVDRDPDEYSGAMKLLEKVKEEKENESEESVRKLGEIGLEILDLEESDSFDEDAFESAKLAKMIKEFGFELSRKNQKEISSDEADNLITAAKEIEQAIPSEGEFDFMDVLLSDVTDQLEEIRDHQSDWLVDLFGGGRPKLNLEQEFFDELQTGIELLEETEDEL